MTLEPLSIMTEVHAMTNEEKSKHEKYAYPYYVLNDNDLNYITLISMSYLNLFYLKN